MIDGYLHYYISMSTLQLLLSIRYYVAQETSETENLQLLESYLLLQKEFNYMMYVLMYEHTYIGTQAGLNSMSTYVVTSACQYYTVLCSQRAIDEGKQWNGRERIYVIIRGKK